MRQKGNISLLNPYRPVFDLQDVTYLDLDNDGDPDVLRSLLSNGMPVQWIDDDDDMKEGDMQGDTDNDCLMIDRNKDGKYGSFSDFIVDWNDTDNDGKADMQVVVDYLEEGNPDGHYMWVLDTDRDNIFNYIDWDKLELRAWVHDGQSDFYEDYHGKSLFLKVHRSTNVLSDTRLNWENPFLFYDPDNDGLSEMAFRLIDTNYTGNYQSRFSGFSGKIIWCSLSFDMDNDNAPGNEFDLDMTVNFSGPGFDYMDQVHHFENMRGLPEADTMFMDPRWRQMTELIYPDHESAWDLVHKRGSWDRVYFTYDEDDDCNRWERVELYQPGNVFRIGPGKGGLDTGGQSDASGDRGEWDLDNSGSGKLYVSLFDGRIHLFGAEWGAWRIDQNAWSYQGMGGNYDGYGPGRLQKQPENFASVKYTDTDNNGFFDQIEYDLDGDTIYENTVSLLKLGLDDRCETIKLAAMDYDGLNKLQVDVAEKMWQNANEASAVAKKAGINLDWYSLLRSPKSIRQKYANGYWLQLYLYLDLVKMGNDKNNKLFLETLDKAYYGGNWKLLENALK